MPRGKRKRGQFLIKLWWPDGDMIAFESSKDIMDIEQWRAAERKALADERALILTAEQSLSDFQALVSLLSQATLLCKDCYRHHREWRRRHVRIDD